MRGWSNRRFTTSDKVTTFFREAAREFHQHRLQLRFAVVGRQNDTRNDTSPGGWDNWSGVYDYNEIGRFADFVSATALKRIAEHSKSTMPPRRISFGVPFYGLRWDTGADGQRRGRSARHRDVPSTAGQQWDEERRSPHVDFEVERRQDRTVVRERPQPRREA